MVWSVGTWWMMIIRSFRRFEKLIIIIIGNAPYLIESLSADSD